MEDLGTRGGNEETVKSLLRLKNKPVLKKTKSATGLEKYEVELLHKDSSVRDDSQQPTLEAHTRLSRHLSGGARSSVIAAALDEDECDLSLSNVTQGECFLDKTQLDLEMRATGIGALSLALAAPEAAQKNLINYIFRVFGFSSSDKEKLCQEAQKESCELRLIFKVIGAESLEHTSELACYFTVLQRRYQNEPIVKEQDMLDWKTAGLINDIRVVPVGSMKPAQQEEQEMPIRDPKEDLLAIEVRNDTNSPSSKRNWKTFHRKKSGGFVGRAFYLLQTVPVEGEMKCLQLYSHSGRHQRGTISMELCVSGQQDDIPTEVLLIEQRKLLWAIVNSDSMTDMHNQVLWDAKLSEAGTDLLAQFVKQNHINKLQELTVYFSVLLEYHKHYKVELFALIDTLDHIRHNRELLPVDLPLWVQRLYADMQCLQSLLLEQLRNHLSTNLKSASSISAIKLQIRALKSLHSFHPFVQRLPVDRKDLIMCLETSVQSAVPRWFLSLSETFMPINLTGDMEMVAFRGFCNHCLHQCQRTLAYLNPLFKENGVDYFSHFFIALDKLLCGELQSRLGKCIDVNDTASLELYRALKEIEKLSEYVDKRMLEGDLQITKLHVCFKGFVVNWIQLATRKCRERILQAIDFDEEVVVEQNDEARYSSSAVDATVFLLQYGAFWKNIDWPVASEAYGYMCIVMENICGLAHFYVETLYQSLVSNEKLMYSVDGKFQATEKLCVGLDNMHHVQTALADMPQKLDLEAFYSWLQKEQGIGEKAHQLINSMLTSNDEDIRNKIAFFVEKISVLLSTDIEKHIKLATLSNTAYREKPSHLPKLSGLFTRSLTPVNTADEDFTDDHEVATPLLEYLSSNLQTLADYLLSPVFRSILHGLWQVVVKCIQTILKAIPKKPSSVGIYHRLNRMLHSLKDFFYSSGNGIDLDELQGNLVYKVIAEELKLLNMKPQELIKTLLYEFAEHQKQRSVADCVDPEQGCLTISVGYLKNIGVVEVSVVHAQHLPAKGKNGLNDVYVEVALQPEWLFVQSSHSLFKTSVQKQTVNPLFGEELRLPATEEALNKVGSVVVLSLYHYHELSSDTLIGTCVVSTTDIPKLQHGTAQFDDPNTPERKNMRLPLANIRSTPVLKELEFRKDAGNASATEFWKINKRTLEHIISA